MKLKISYLLSITTAILFLAGCTTEHRAMHWEYKTAATIPLGPEQTDSFLNGMAKDGWILVQQNHDGFYIFKRAIN